jgi:ribonuclease HIII
VYKFPDDSKYLVHQDCIEGSKALSGGTIKQIHPTSYDMNTDSFVFYSTYTYNRLYAKYYPTGVKEL